MNSTSSTVDTSPTHQVGPGCQAATSADVRQGAATSAATSVATSAPADDSASQTTWLDCGSCGGDGHHGYDEDGRLYACYACGCEGGHRVPNSLLPALRWAAYVRLERSILADAAQRKFRESLGIPDGWGYYYDDIDGEVHLIASRSERQPTRMPDDLDDLPF